MTQRIAYTTLLICLITNFNVMAEEDNPSLSPSYTWGRGITLPFANLTLGGYFNGSYSQEEKLKNHISTDDISLFITWTPHDRLRFFSEIELEDWITNYGVEDIDNAYRVERLYGDVFLTNKLTLRFGKILTPVGRWNMLHAGPLVWTSTRPVITKKSYTPEHLTGAMLTYKSEFMEHNIELSLYGDDANELDIHREELETDNAFGGRLTIDINDDLQIGTSYLNFSKNIEELRLSRNQEFGFDFLFKKNHYELLMEFIYTHTKDFQGDKKGFYLQGVAPLFYHVYAVGRYEYLNDNNRLIPNDAHIGVMGLTWRPFTPLSVKAEYRIGENNQYISPNGFFASIAVFF